MLTLEDYHRSKHFPRRSEAEDDSHAGLVEAGRRDENSTVADLVDHVRGCCLKPNGDLK